MLFLAAVVFIVFVRPACLSHQLVDDKEGLKPLADELAVLILDKKKADTEVSAKAYWNQRR
jgi:hypothetical protein